MLPRRVGAYSPAWIDELCAAGELVWVGAGALGRSGGGWPCTSARTLRCSAHRRLGASVEQTPAHDARARASGTRRVLLHRPARRGGLAGGRASGGHLGPRVGRRGDKRRVRAAALAPVTAAGPRGAGQRPTGAPASPSRSSGASRRRPAWLGRFHRPPRRAPLQGRWSLTASLFGSLTPAVRRRALAELLLERYGILTREQVLAEGVPGGFAALYSGCTRSRPSAPHGGGTSSRGSAAPSSRCPGRSNACACPSPTRRAPSCWPPPTPRSSTARRCTGRGGGGRRPRPVAAARRLRRARRRPAGRLGRGWGPYATGPRRSRPPRVAHALAALAAAVREGRVPRLAIEKIDGEPAIASPRKVALLDLGFRAGPRRLTLNRGDA